MKNNKEIFLEITSSDSIPANGGLELPLSVVDSWKASLDYDYRMKRKFSYFDVAFKTNRLTRGFKGHLTKTQKKLDDEMKFHKLDPAKTIKELYRLYPPKYF